MTTAQRSWTQNAITPSTPLQGGSQSASASIIDIWDRMQRRTAPGEPQTANASITDIWDWQLKTTSPHGVSQPASASITDLWDWIRPKTNSGGVQSLTVAEIERLGQLADEELRRYLTFEPAWDGYDGLTFNEQAIDRARQVVQLATVFFVDVKMVPDEITPGPASDGSVDVEFSACGRTLIFTFDREQFPARVYAREGQSTHDREDDLQDATVVRWLGWLVGSLGVPDAVDAARRDPAYRVPLAIRL